MWFDPGLLPASSRGIVRVAETSLADFGQWRLDKKIYELMAEAKCTLGELYDEKMVQTSGWVAVRGMFSSRTVSCLLFDQR